MAQNPMEIMQQLKTFMGGYKGDPEQEARQMIQQAGLNQQQLNQLQSQANSIYAMAQKFGLIK